MAYAVNSPEDVVNIALAKIGFKLRVASLTEGTLQAKKALDIYSQTRDALLRAGDWGFAKQIVAGVVTGQTPPFPWTSEYGYPTTCLKVRQIFDATYVASPNDPLPYNWEIGNNALGNRVIWCDAAGATLVLTTQITNPTQWDTLFIRMFADDLARTLVPALASSGDLIKPLAEEQQVSAAAAESTVG